MALLFTFISGLFFLIGIVLFNFVHSKEKISLISTSCAAVILIYLIFFDLLKELVEINIYWVYSFVLIGLITISLIDKVVPHHHHDHHDKDEECEEHIGHAKHIGIVTITALLLHNMIEGMALYGIASSDVQKGFLVMATICLHNLPFGFQIADLNRDNKNIALIALLILSGTIGGLIMHFVGDVGEVFEGVVIAVTMGMLIHLLFFELLHEVYSNIKRKETIIGLLIGVLLVIIINII